MSRQITIWRIDASRHPAAEGIATCLTAAELAAASRMRKADQRHTWTMVRSALRQILANETNSDPLSVSFAANPYGKPSLPADANPYDLHFNVSHSGTIGLIAVARVVEIGIDIEQMRPELDPQVIFPQAFSRDEIRHLESLSGEAQKNAFYRCWVRKEAAVKATGLGLSCPLDGFSALGPDVAALGVDVLDIPVPTGYAGALAVQKDPGGSAIQIRERTWIP